jgi:hypothetical protein
MGAASVQNSMKGCTVVHVFRIGLNKQVKCLLQVQYNDNNKPKQVYCGISLSYCISPFSMGSVGNSKIH